MLEILFAFVPYGEQFIAQLSIHWQFAEVDIVHCFLIHFFGLRLWRLLIYAYSVPSFVFCKKIFSALQLVVKKCTLFGFSTVYVAGVRPHLTTRCIKYHVEADEQSQTYFWLINWFKDLCSKRNCECNMSALCRREPSSDWGNHCVDRRRGIWQKPWFLPRRMCDSATGLKQYENNTKTHPRGNRNLIKVTECCLLLQ